MSIRNLLVVLASLTATCAYAGNYYCSRANVLLREMPYPEFSTGMAGAGAPFPAKLKEIDKEPRSVSVNLVGTKCSTEDFECIKYTEYFGPTKRGKTFFLFSPKKLERYKEYRFNGMVMISENAKVTDSLENGAIQATIWQEFAGKRRPIKLTLQQGHGVVYIDGLRLVEGNDFSNSCALRGNSGIFSDVAVQPLSEAINRNSERID